VLSFPTPFCLICPYYSISAISGQEKPCTEQGYQKVILEYYRTVSRWRVMYQLTPAMAKLIAAGVYISQISWSTPIAVNQPTRHQLIAS
jgi:hypothetical protein